MKNSELNISRKFRDDRERNDYFKFPNKDSNGNPSSYQMNNKQMNKTKKQIIPAKNPNSAEKNSIELI